MALVIASNQVCKKLKEKRFKYDRETKRVKLFRNPDGKRVSVPQKKRLSRTATGIILMQAGFNQEETKQFLRDATD